MSFKDAHFHKLDPKDVEYTIGQLELAKDLVVRRATAEMQVAVGVVMALTPVLPLRILGGLLLAIRVLTTVTILKGISAHIAALKGEGDSDA